MLSFWYLHVIKRLCMCWRVRYKVYIQLLSEPDFRVSLLITSTSVFGDGRISTYANPTSTRRAILIGTRLRKQFPPWTLLPGGWPIRPILGFCWRKVPPKWEISCPGRRWTTVQNLTPLALSAPEKSVTVQTKIKRQNKITNSKRYTHILPIGMCG